MSKKYRIYFTILFSTRIIRPHKLLVNVKLTNIIYLNTRYNSSKPYIVY